MKRRYDKIIARLQQDLKHEQDVLNTPVKVWEPEMKLRLEQNIEDFEKVIAVVKKMQSGIEDG